MLSGLRVHHNKRKSKIALSCHINNNYVCCFNDFQVAMLIYMSLSKLKVQTLSQIFTRSFLHLMG